MLADVRLEDVKVAVDQLGRAEGDFIGEMNMAAVRLNGLALERNLTGNVALRVLIVLPFDVDAWPNPLDGADGVGSVIDRHPVDIFQGSEHFGAQLAAEHRPTRPFVHK